MKSMWEDNSIGKTIPSRLYNLLWDLFVNTVSDQEVSYNMPAICRQLINFAKENDMVAQQIASR